MRTSVTVYLFRKLIKFNEASNLRNNLLISVWIRSLKRWHVILGFFLNHNPPLQTDILFLVAFLRLGNNTHRKQRSVVAVTVVVRQSNYILQEFASSSLPNRNSGWFLLLRRQEWPSDCTKLQIFPLTAVPSSSKMAKWNIYRKIETTTRITKLPFF